MTKEAETDLAPLGGATALKAIAETLNGADDGELFIERTQSESLVFDDGRLRSASFDESEGFGLRAVSGETAAYAHSSMLNAAALKRAAETCGSILTAGKPAMVDIAPAPATVKLYGSANPVEALGFAAKVNLMEEVNAFTRSLDPRISQVSVTLASSWQRVTIARGDGSLYHDVRPLTRFGVSVTTSDNRTSGQGSHGLGGREAPETYITESTWKDAAREAVRQALVGLEAEAAPAGEMDVLLGPGWPGILLHEAIGHGLEGDFNRKGTSAFAGLLGQRIAAEDVTVVDDGTIPGRRGSLTIDDEGTAPNCTTLIEKGILVGFMQDRLNARLMGVKPTGNGRRQSYAHVPLPRMTNTYMLNGRHHPDEIRASMKKGIYAKSFGGGQVDITSGKFVFTCTEAYLIEDGKIGRPVKGAILIGAGAEALKRIAMVGNDMALDPGVGTCGKAGQGVPVGVGQPTLRINNLTVGGTAA
ncbi:MAG: metalloprotease TldD [Alphaproteobacteria bacterium]|nr:metalloprotease TldD [Alphaproteobacteria bacterium]